jgi:hypothetical protein
VWFGQEILIPEVRKTLEIHYHDTALMILIKYLNREDVNTIWKLNLCCDKVTRRKLVSIPEEG